MASTTGHGLTQLRTGGASRVVAGIQTADDISTARCIQNGMKYHVEVFLVGRVSHAFS